jgi:hypothetical protein
VTLAHEVQKKIQNTQLQDLSTVKGPIQLSITLTVPQKKREANIVLVKYAADLLADTEMLDPSPP